MGNHHFGALKLHRFELSFAEKDLRELRCRLIATNWTGDEGNPDRRYGVKQSYPEELVIYGLTDFDWRSVRDCPVSFLKNLLKCFASSKPSS